MRDNAMRLEFLGTKTLNIDNFEESIFLNKKKLLRFNRRLYKDFVKNYLKHHLSKKEPWYISFNRYFNKNKKHENFKTIFIYSI